MNLIILLTAMFLLGLVVMGVCFLFMEACEKFYLHFRKFKYTAIYRIIQDKRLQPTAEQLKQTT